MFSDKLLPPDFHRTPVRSIAGFRQDVFNHVVVPEIMYYLWLCETLLFIYTVTYADVTIHY